MESKLEAIKQLSELGSRLTGIEFKPSQYQMIELRLATRIKDLQLKSFGEYYNYLNRNLAKESKNFISLITTHHTYFFREFAQFEYLLDGGLKKIVEEARARNENVLKIWCAAASTGEEPYSISMFMNAHLKSIAPGFDFKVVATDIDELSIDRGRGGVYRNDHVNQIPQLYLNGSFVKGEGTAAGFSRVRKHLKEKCDFVPLNLFSVEKFRPEEKFDIIFCRNVFIYFNEADVKKIVNHLLTRLHKGGLFLTGLSESLIRHELPITSIFSSVYVRTEDKVKSVAKASLSAEKTAPKLLDVLCVDDSQSIHKLMNSVLANKYGFNVKAQALNGADALEKLRTQKFDLITLDLSMPVLDGIGFLSQYKGDTPVLVVSSINREDLSFAQKAISLGAKDYVEKPTLSDLERSGDQIRSKLKTIHVSSLKTANADRSNVVEFKPRPNRGAIAELPQAKVDQPQLQNSSLPKVKVLLVDDSIPVLKLLHNMVSTDSNLEVVGQVTDPRLVEEAIDRLKPDVVTLDIHMPHRDGLAVLKDIKARYSIPTVMISAMNKEDATIVVKAMQIGAYDFIQKPTYLQYEESKAATCAKILAAARSKTITFKKVTPAHFAHKDLSKNLILVGSSTGGPEAVKIFLQQLPPNIPPIVIVQHIPEHFSESLAKHLNELVSFSVKEAEEGDVLQVNNVYIARGGKQLSIQSRADKKVLLLEDSQSHNKHKPSVDYTFNSICNAKNTDFSQIVGIILTGMGSDGAISLKRLHDLGAFTIAQDESTSVIFGMPREAIAKGGVSKVLPLPEISNVAMEYFANPTKVLKGKAA